MNQNANEVNKVQLRKEVQERSLSYVVAAFGFVAGLAWNDAVRSLIEYLFPLARNTIVMKFVYAVVVTFIAVVITAYLARLLQKGSGKL